MVSTHLQKRVRQETELRTYSMQIWCFSAELPNHIGRSCQNAFI